MEVQNTLRWLIDVRFGRNEAEVSVQPLRVNHRGKGGEHQSIKTQLVGLSDERFDESTTDTTGSLTRVHIQSTDLPDGAVHEKGNNAERAVFVGGQ